MTPKNKVIACIKILLYAELCLQAISLGRFAYSKFQFDQEIRRSNKYLWATRDPRFHWWFEESPLITDSYMPYVNWKTNDIATPHITVQNGIRKTAGNPAHVDASTKQVYMFGGSTLWGYLAKDDETIPSFLAKELNKDGTWQITNFANMGYKSSQELVQFMFLLEQGHVPDLVIFYDGYNDLRANTLDGKKQQLDVEQALTRKLGNLDDYSRDEAPENRSIYSVSAVQSIADFVVTYVKVVRYPVQFIRLLMHQRDSETTAESSDSLDPQSTRDAATTLALDYQQHARIIDSLSKTYGFRYMLVWQPIIADKTLLTDEEKKLVELFKIPLETGPVWTQAKNNLKQLHIPNFYDISDIFSEYEKTVFFDKSHITPEGNRMVAEKIRDIMYDAHIGR